MKGTGKSQLALKYAQEHKEESTNHIVWKIKCQNTSLLQRALEFLHRSLGCIITNPNFPDICRIYGNSIVTKLKTLCQHHSDLSPLFILDNVTETTLEKVEIFLNQLQECTSIKVIATTEVLPGFSQNVLEINGFTGEESCTFLSGNKHQNESEKELSLELAKKINSNPLGLYIFRTLMYQQNWSIGRINEIIKSFYFSLTNMESIAGRHEVEDRLFGHLRAVLDIVKETDKAIFKLLSVLKFMDKNEEIPIILLEFYSMQIGLLDILTVEKFVKKIKDASFGMITGEDDFRVLKTHEVVILVLEMELDTNSPSDMHTMLHLLKSCIMVISHDNRSWKDLKINKLVLPHAIEVVRHAEKLFTTLENTLDIKVIVEYKTLLMLVNHLIGYTLSYNKSLLAMDYLAKAKQQIFSLCNVELTE
ncbi:Hypothetical predicted protein [Mytilus galloprovincialis]|uniref:NB-ARC domain-containing protein n=1 Tax=Mytilus galloprovincialis TaxID=29158 RepID=A0A8B6HF56_MYTGA|nr:Hypothetical predicted protein [Mytilus galloprovincialis]